MTKLVLDEKANIVEKVSVKSEKFLVWFILCSQEETTHHSWV